VIPFTFRRAQSPEHAVASMTTDGRFLAGGTTLVDLMKLEVETPGQLVDLGALQRGPLGAIEPTDSGGLRIGAMVKNSTLARDPRIVRDYPVLSEALLSGASPQLRNMATVGGNVLQRTRCPYFRDVALPCNKRSPGSGCGAVEGYNRHHAILGTSSDCIATHASDMCVALVALDAVVHLEGPAGARTVPFADFHLEPGDTPHLENVLGPSELIVAVELPALDWARRSHYLKVRDRASYEFALTSAAVALQLDASGVVRNARIALGGVGTKPWRAHRAEAALIGQRSGRAAYEAAARTELAGAVAREHNAFKIELAVATVVRALEELETSS